MFFNCVVCYCDVDVVDFECEFVEFCDIIDGWVGENVVCERCLKDVYD